MKLGCFLLRCSRTPQLSGSSEEAELTKEGGEERRGGKGPQITRRPPQTFVACQQTRNSPYPSLNLDAHTTRTPSLLPPFKLAPKIPRFEKRAETQTERQSEEGLIRVIS